MWTVFELLRSNDASLCLVGLVRLKQGRGIRDEGKAKAYPLTPRP
jgi:hypothetical protein